MPRPPTPPCTSTSPAPGPAAAPPALLDALPTTGPFAVVAPAPPGRVLVVEDDRPVRTVAVSSLQDLGYRTLEAENADAALDLLRTGARPDVLFTDVVMPGMSGRELAESLTPLRQEMKTLYMSGYADDAILHHGVLDSGSALLQKPFTAEALANKVRRVLEQS